MCGGGDVRKVLNVVQMRQFGRTIDVVSEFSGHCRGVSLNPNQRKALESGDTGCILVSKKTIEAGPRCIQELAEPTVNRG